MCQGTHPPQPSGQLGKAWGGQSSWVSCFWLQLCLFIFLWYTNITFGVSWWEKLWTMLPFKKMGVNMVKLVLLYVVLPQEPINNIKWELTVYLLYFTSVNFTEGTEKIIIGVKQRASASARGPVLSVFFLWSCSCSYRYVTPSLGLPVLSHLGLQRSLYSLIFNSFSPLSSLNSFITFSLVI